MICSSPTSNKVTAIGEGVDTLRDGTNSAYKKAAKLAKEADSRMKCNFEGPKGVGFALISDDLRKAQTVASGLYAATLFISFGG